MITVWISGISFKAYADISFECTSDAGKGVTDLKTSLESIFEDNLVETKDDFLKTVSTENQYIKSMISDRKILQPSVNSQGLKHSKADELEVVRVGGESMGLLYCRLIPLVLLLVDDKICYPDWRMYLIVEKKTDQQDSPQKLLGFAALYRFFHYPDSHRLRLGQMLVLPPYQRKGYGGHLLQTLTDMVVSDNMYDLSIEEPLEVLQHVRVCIDIPRLLALEAISELSCRDSGASRKRVIDVPTEYDPEASFVMLKTTGGGGDEPKEVEMEENDKKIQEEQLQKLVDERMEAIKLVEQKIKEFILSPSSEYKMKEHKTGVDPSLSKFVEHYLKKQFDERQMEALCTAVYEDALPFTLIQGPPGTGKTHTIIGILNLKPRYLVCAPSNAATDDILLKLLRISFLGQKLEKYNPKIVRIGFNSQLEDAKMVCLEAKAKTYIRKTNQEVLIQQLNPGTNSDLEVTFLEEAIVIFTTVSGCKERILQSINDNAFNLVIIDEAGRMHPSISQFPYTHFYMGQLKDSDLIRSRGELPYLRPYVFYDVGNEVEQKPGSSSSSSYFNERESVVCYELYNQLQDNMKLHGRKDEIRVGVITPYTKQVECIKKRFVEGLNEEALKNICFETIDAFQGQERDVIILSCVRTQDLGFVSDRRRMNVALTRAKRVLWVVGKKTALIHSKDWNALILDAERRKCCHNY
ncbi:histone acetyltransferase type B catalytic subunit [Tanacetum coccineum]